LPIYDLSAVAHAIDITPKQLDNLLSRNELRGVERKARGVTRRISSDAAVAINIAWQLSQATKVPIANALELSHRLTVGSDHSVPLGDHLTLAVDLAAIRADTIARLDAAVETVGRRRRGRPPKSARRGPVGDL
jgi:hypothetical protein